MKKIIVSLLFISCLMKASHGSTDKVYSVPSAPSEILIGREVPLLNNRSDNRPQHLFYVGLLSSTLTYKLPSYNSTTSKFSPAFPGISLSRKIADEFRVLKGYFELNGEWESFKRESGIFSQKIHIYKVALIQNIDLARSIKNNFFFSAGLGVAPIYVAAEKSIFGNSISSLGAMGLIKLDFVYPTKKFEYGLSLKGGWGKVDGNDIYLSTLGLGINFE